MTTPQKLVLTVLAAVIATLSVVGPVLAVTPGRAGKIAFTSGREGANDNAAQIYLIKPDGTGLSEPLGIPTLQNRHAAFSPDRTKMVFAAGTPGPPQTEEFDLYVRDFVDGTTIPLDVTQVGDGLSSDHPVWSPDGTRVAYETQPVDNSLDRNIMVKVFGSGQPATAITTGPLTEFKPAYSPDGQTIYYATQAAAPPASNLQLSARPASGGPEIPMNNTAADDYQPSISPDGSKICFTQQVKPGDTSSAEIVVAELPGPVNPVNLSEDGTKGDINCSWSPDGRRIAYTNGVFEKGRLVMERSDNSEGVPTPITDDAGSNNFDGNADWVGDGSPQCDDRTVRTEPGTAITLELECTDTGPAYELSNPNGTVANDGAPQNGVLSGESPFTDPSTVVYTPNAGFTGADRVVYTAFDDAGFGTDRGTITIQVGSPAGRCAGREATITGTDGADVLRGTPGADVIAAGAGKDRVRGAKGRDLICGDAGKDRLAGGGGKDRLDGGSAKDRCSGGPGKDRQSKCEVSR